MPTLACALGTENLYVGLQLSGLVHRLHLAAPELAGSPTDERRDMLVRELPSMLGGNPFVLGTLVLTAWHMHTDALGEGSAVGVRVVCLDEANPLVLEVLRESTNDESVPDDGSLCVSILGRSEAYCLGHSITRAVLDFYGVPPEWLQESLETSRKVHLNGLHEYSTPSSILMARLDEAHEQFEADLAFADAVMREQQEAAVAKVKQEAAQAAKRAGRAQQRLVESLSQQLETARAIAERQRSQAGAAERALRELRAASSNVGEHPRAAEQPDRSSDDLEQRLEAANTTIYQLTQTVDELKDQNYQLQQRVLSLTAEDPQPVKNGSPGTDAVPESFAQLETWLDEHIPSDRLFVHPKAIKAARRSIFQDPTLVFRVLRALSDHYWPMFIQGDTAASAKWADFLATERLSCQPTGEAVNTHRTSDSYQIQLGGRRYPLDMHIKGSSSRKEQHGLRLYFHASKDARRIFVGHFPGHLTNRES